MARTDRAGYEIRNALQDLERAERSLRVAIPNLRGVGDDGTVVIIDAALERLQELIVIVGHEA